MRLTGAMRMLPHRPTAAFVAVATLLLASVPAFPGGSANDAKDCGPDGGMPPGLHAAAAACPPGAGSGRIASGPAAGTGLAAPRLRDAVAVAQEATRAQASMLGVRLPDAVAIESGHVSPSDALEALASRFGAPIDREDAARLAALDAAAGTSAVALTRFVEAFLVLDDATRQERPVAELFAARNALLDAVVAVAAATAALPPAATAQGGACRPLVVAPAFAIDLEGCDAVYDEDVALLLDVGGDDHYRNNAGGNNLQGGAWPRTEPTAAALVDLDGDDLYADLTSVDHLRRSGAIGGARNGVGFLVDAAGDDRYVGFRWGVNGGGHAPRGFGFLLDVAGDDEFAAYGSGVNGGAGGGGSTGLLLDMEGDDTYYAVFGGASQGEADATGVGLLRDDGGRDTYQEAFDRCDDCSVVPKGAFGAQFDSDDTPPPGDVADGIVERLGLPPLPGLPEDPSDLPPPCVGAPHPPIRITEDVGPHGFALAHLPGTGDAVPRPGSGVIGGKATAADPYLIQGWCIVAQEPPDDLATTADALPLAWGGIHIEGTRAHVRVVGNTVDARALDVGGLPVDLDAHVGEGVVVRDAHHVALVDNTVRGVPDVAFLVEDAADVELRGNRVDGLGQGAGPPYTAVRLDRVTAGVVAGNHLADPQALGVLVGASPGVRVEDNVVEGDSGYAAVRILGSPAAVVARNILTGSGRAVSVLDGSHGALVADNHVEGGGVDVLLASDVVVRGNLLLGNRGLVVLVAPGAVVERNHFAGPATLTVRDADAVVRDNVFEPGGSGIGVEGMGHVRLEHNDVRGRLHGLFIGDVTSLVVEGNVFRDNLIGILAPRDPNEAVVVRGNDIVGNGIGAAANVGSGLDARDNWWGCPAGPTDPACDAMIGPVNFTPWRTEPVPGAGPRP